MGNNSGSDDYTVMRRKGRAVSDDRWIKQFLKKTAYGTLATADGDQPFLNFMTFVFDEKKNAIYLHSAHKGRTRANIENNPNVCFGVAQIGRFYPGKTAMEFSNEYSSVMVYGKAALVDDINESRRAMSMLMEKYFPHLEPGRDYHPITDRELEITSVYKIKIEQWIGKQNSQPDDKPGAFFYDDSNKRSSSKK